MNRRRAQFLLVIIMIPIVVSAGYAVYSILNGYPPPSELILTVGGVVFIEAFLAAFVARKPGKKKQGRETSS